MNSHGSSSLLVGALLLAGCTAQEPSRSARRPVDFFEISRLSDATDPHTELVTTKFLLLERAEVCADMGLSQAKSNVIRSVYETPWEQIPGLTEFRAQQRAAKQKGDLTQEERASLNIASSRGIGRIIAQFRTQQIQINLSPRQIERLEQLLLQARGPLLLVIDTNLAARLELTPEQMKRMSDVVRQTDEKLIPAFQEFGRGFVSGYSPNETEQDRIRKLNDLIPRLQRMVQERDEALSRVLTPKQQNRFNGMKGKPLPVEWDPLEFTKQPFEKTNS